MKNYRMYNGDSFDVYILTDTSNDNKQFLISQINQLNSQEVIDGFFFREGDEINEGDLVAFANRKCLVLDSYSDNTFLNNIVELSYFGIFNGSSSHLLYSPGFTLASPTDFYFPIELSFDFRIDSDYSGFTYFMSTDQDEDAYWDTNITRGGGNIIISSYIDYNLTTGVYVEFVIAEGEIINDFHNLKVTLTESGGTATTSLFLDNVLKGSDSAVLVGVPGIEVFKFNFGSYYDPSLSDFYLGDMKDLILTVNSVEVLNTPDPSTGVNDGTGDDGVATNVVQGS